MFTCRKVRRMPKLGSQPANCPLIWFVTAKLNFASHRLRNRISSTNVPAIVMDAVCELMGFSFALRSADWRRVHPLSHKTHATAKQPVPIATSMAGARNQ